MRRPAAGDNQGVSDDYDYYQDTSGIQPWVPPAGFANPVPPARDDATPAGHIDSWRASHQRHGSDSGGRTGPPLWLLFLIGAVVLGLFVVKPWVDDNSDRVEQLIDDAEKILEDFRDSVETDAGAQVSSQLSEELGRAPAFKQIETHGQPGFVFSGTDTGGDSRLVVWYFGEDHS